MTFALEEVPVPAVGSRWQHHNGNVYSVILIANMESTRDEYPVTVVYRNEKNSTLWSRPLSQWHRSMKRLT